MPNPVSTAAPAPHLVSRPAETEVFSLPTGTTLGGVRARLTDEHLHAHRMYRWEPDTLHETADPENTHLTLFFAVTETDEDDFDPEATSPDDWHGSARLWLTWHHQLGRNNLRIAVTGFLGGYTEETAAGQARAAWRIGNAAREALTP